MPKNLEIERKFLVKKLPGDWRRHRHSKIVQGYFPMATREIEIRLRRRDDACCLAVKGGQGSARQEEEFRLPRKQFAALWPLTRGARIAKTRYEIPFDGRMIEMDVYGGAHRGLMTADVEFKSRKESRNFRPPKWLGREITGNRRFANAVLARRHRSR